MTQAALFRKAVILCTAVAGAAGLSACDAPTIGETFARLKAVDVDGGEPAAADNPGYIKKKDVELVIDTARNLTVGDGGVLNRDARPQRKPEYAVVDALDMPRPDAETALMLRAAAHDLPDIPVVQPKPAAGHLIQVGSFSTTAAAQNAWRELQARYPGVERYSPSFQQITTAAGKPMVRLKIGPVAPEQAQALCGQLGVSDAWCVKAS